jgi:serine/threonine-protein kinase
MRMDSLLWDRLEALFAAAADLPPAERAAYLDATCSGDPALRMQVESLLVASEEASGVIGRAVSGTAREAAGVARAGQRLGAYEVVRELGRGGMGAVFLGRRADQEYEADVAIKLIRGVHTADQLRRFRSERQILAKLRHPNIAQMLDGGTTVDGVPYVVMEHVDGVPLDQYCNQHRLTIDQRLDLFATICGAVRFAHQNLVVHCDLKPANILVAPDGIPKLLDFGIARLLEPGGPGAETLTATRFGTPAYASPEQITGSPVSVATDVHGLGVVLYELLTGRLPYPVHGKSPHELERLVLDSEPTLPSAAATQDGAAESGVKDVAADRATDPDRLAQRLSGDLDSILLTALQKDPARRYESVEGLVQDIGRHRSGLPVLAHAGGRAYRAGKFVRRHRASVGVAAAAVLLVGTFTATVTVQSGRLARERDAATVARTSSEEVSSFLIDIFELSDPSESRGNQITVREILDRAAAAIPGELGEQPATRATMMDVMGRVYHNLGLYAQANPLIDSALVLRQATLGAVHPAVASSLNSAAELRFTLGDYDSSRVLFHHALALRRRLLPAGDPAIAETLAGLASLESDAGEYEAAEPLFREALAIDRATYGDAHLAVANGLANLGSVLRRKGDYDGAEPLLRESLAMRRRLLGEDHVDVGQSLNALARLLFLQGRHAEAEAFAREELAVHRKVFGDDAIEVAYSLGNLSAALDGQGDREGAIAARRESVRIARHVFGDEHPTSAAGLQSLASDYHGAGALDSARVIYEYALGLQRNLLASTDPNLGFALTGLGRVLVDLGRAADAEPYLREALAVRQGGLPPDHYFIASSESALGDCLTRLGRYAEAEPLLTKSVATLERAFGGADERTEDARQRLAALYSAWERP